MHCVYSLHEEDLSANDLKRERKRLEVQLGYTGMRLNQIQTELQVLERDVDLGYKVEEREGSGFLKAAFTLG